MQEKGIIQKLSHESAVIVIEKEGEESCSNCKIKGICRLNDKSERSIEIARSSVPEGLIEGARVKVSIPGGTSVFYAFLLFIMPLVVIIAILLPARKALGEPLALLVSVSAGAAYFICVSLIERFLVRKIRIEPDGD